MPTFFLPYYAVLFKFRWLILAVLATVVLGIVVWFVPSAHVKASQVFHKGKSLVLGEEKVEVMPLVIYAKQEEIDSLKEQLGQIEQTVSAQKIELASAKQAVLENQEQLKQAVAEVGKANDLLDKRQTEWLATLKRVGVSVTPALGSNKLNSTPTPNTKSGKINLNSATLAELDSLPGIGPTFAQRILDYRKEKGLFKKVDDLLSVSGIGATLLGKIKDLVDV